MADVTVTPRIRCDNCGRTEDKEKPSFEKTYRKPHGWGSIRVDCIAGTYPPHITMPDVCQICFKAAYDGAGAALEKARSEGFDGPTAAE